MYSETSFVVPSLAEKEEERAKEREDQGFRVSKKVHM